MFFLLQCYVIVFLIESDRIFMLKYKCMTKSDHLFEMAQLKSALQRDVRVTGQLVIKISTHLNPFGDIPFVNCYF